MCAHLLEPEARVHGCEISGGDIRVIQAACGILFVLHAGLLWEWLPRELGFGSGMMCWRWLRGW